MPRANGVRILHIEDDSMLAEVVSLALGKAGYEVFSRPGGTSGIEALYEVLPAAVLLDLKMPLMDGFEVLSSMCAHSALRERPVVCLTAMTSRSYIERAFSLGAEGYVFKPVNFTLLATLLGALTGGGGHEERRAAMLSDPLFGEVVAAVRGAVGSLLELDIVGALSSADPGGFAAREVALDTGAGGAEAEAALSRLEEAGIVERNGEAGSFTPAAGALADGRWNGLAETAVLPDRRVAFINLLYAGLLDRED